MKQTKSRLPCDNYSQFDNTCRFCAIRRRLSNSSEIRELVHAFEDDKRVDSNRLNSLYINYCANEDIVWNGPDFGWYGKGDPRNIKKFVEFVLKEYPELCRHHNDQKEIRYDMNLVEKLITEEGA